MIDREGVCGRVKQAREEAGLTQQQMADVLNVTVRSVQLYETERVPWEYLSRICAITGASLGWLMQGQDFSHLATDVVERLQRIEEKLERLASSH